jgi:hypothetical protein
LAAGERLAPVAAAAREAALDTIAARTHLDDTARSITEIPLWRLWTLDLQARALRAALQASEGGSGDPFAALWREHGERRARARQKLRRGPARDRAQAARRLAAEEALNDEEAILIKATMAVTESAPESIRGQLLDVATERHKVVGQLEPALTTLLAAHVKDPLGPYYRAVAALDQLRLIADQTRFEQSSGAAHVSGDAGEWLVRVSAGAVFGCVIVDPAAVERGGPRGRQRLIRTARRRPDARRRADLAP